MGDQHPPISRFEVIRLHEEGFVRVEYPIKIIILVPFILGIIYFIVYRRLCKVELRWRKSDSESQLCKHDALLTSFGAIRTMSPGRCQHWSDNQTSGQREGTVFFMELFAQGR